LRIKRLKLAYLSHPCLKIPMKGNSGRSRRFRTHSLNRWRNCRSCDEVIDRVAPKHLVDSREDCFQLAFGNCLKPLLVGCDYSLQGNRTGRPLVTRQKPQDLKAKPERPDNLPARHFVGPQRRHVIDVFLADKPDPDDPGYWRSGIYPYNIR